MAGPVGKAGNQPHASGSASHHVLSGSKIGILAWRSWPSALGDGPVKVEARASRFDSRTFRFLRWYTRTRARDVICILARVATNHRIGYFRVTRRISRSIVVFSGGDLSTSRRR